MGLNHITEDDLVLKTSKGTHILTQYCIDLYLMVLHSSWLLYEYFYNLNCFDLDLLYKKTSFIKRVY